jgi:hypothetical protein
VAKITLTSELVCKETSREAKPESFALVDAECLVYMSKGEMFMIFYVPAVWIAWKRYLEVLIWWTGLTDSFLSFGMVYSQQYPPEALEWCFAAEFLHLLWQLQTDKWPNCYLQTFSYLHTTILNNFSLYFSLFFKYLI